MSLANPRTRSFPPVVAAVLVLGFALSIAHQLAIPDEVFVSGDGGIKALIAKQFARGVWHADLRLPADPWVQEIWQDGLYPFGPPFAYAREGRWFLQYPLPFMVLTSPFYDWFGFRGLTFVPLLGLWLLWLSVAVILRRFDVSESASAIALAGLLFCSFVTPYGAMYWEHTLALGLSFLGLALLVGASAAAGHPWRHFVAGALLGVSVWFRPESACFAAGVCLGVAVLGRGLRPWLAACLGVALPCLAIAGFNLWLHGSPLGVHAVQRVDPETFHVPHIPAHEIAGYFVSELFRLCPFVAVLIACSVAGIGVSALRIGRTEAALWGVVVSFCVGTSLLVPNNGGTQLGARYFLFALPPLFLLLAFAWDRAAALGVRGRQGLRFAIAASLLAGVYLNAVRGTKAIFRDYRTRILPALHAVREEPTGVVAVEHQWMAQELESAFDDKAFFRVRNRAELEQLARAMHERGHPRFTLVRWDETQESVVNAGSVRIRMRSRGRFGSYVLIECEVDQGQAPGSDRPPQRGPNTNSPS